MLLDVRWYDEKLDKFWYPEDDMNGYYYDKESRKNYVFSLGIDLDNLVLVPNIYEVDTENDWIKQRVLTKMDRFTGIIEDGIKVYENDILHRMVNIVFFGDDNRDDNWVNDCIIPEYREDYLGFFAGEKELWSQLGVTYTDGFKCTEFKVAGNTHQNSDLMEKWFNEKGKESL